MHILVPLVAILALLAPTEAAPICEDLVKPIQVQDMTLVMGRWWFLAGFSDNKVYTDILKVVNSSWMTFAPTNKADVLILSQGNKINGKCEFSTVNMTLMGNTLHLNQTLEGVNLSTEVFFRPSGEDYLSMTLKTEMADTKISSLYLFGRSRKLSDEELKKFYKQAECLSYSTPAPYIYDGVMELCDQAQHQQQCEPLLRSKEIKDPKELLGKWIFLKGFVSSKQLIDMLKITQASWMSLIPTSKTDTFTMSQGNKLGGVCLFSNNTITFTSSAFHSREVFEQLTLVSKGYFLSSSPNLLTMSVKAQMGTENIRALYMFGRSKTISAADVEDFEKQAECLGWIREAHYTYDGVTEFCVKSA